MSLKLKKWNTEKIQNIVKTAVEQMPKNATNIILVEGYRHKVGAFGTHHCWTEVEAVYKNDEGKEVGRVRTIDKVGGWQYSDPANYVLYHMGLYKPYNEDNLKSIRCRYEWELNHGMLNPINSIYSDAYKIKALSKKALYEQCKDGMVTLTFVLDYDYINECKVKWNTKEYCFLPKISYGEWEITGEHHKWMTSISILLGDIYDEFKKYNMPIKVVFEMKQEDYDKLIVGRLTRWWEGKTY